MGLGRVQPMPNEGYLDKSVHWKVRSGQIGFAEPTHDEVADAILDVGLATEVGQRLGSGKEADVYLCRDGRPLTVVKVYRQYRTSHRGGGSIKLESMGQRASREFELLCYAWQGGARVPEPGRRVENMFSMQYLGGSDAAAPMLQHVRLENPERFLQATMAGVEGLAEAGIVHSDLSPFNILVHQEQPWFIDLAAGIRVDRLGSPPWVRLNEALRALEKGIAALERYFRRYGLLLDSGELLVRVRSQIDRFRVT
jgi:RIO kinase 1